MRRVVMPLCPAVALKSYPPGTSPPAGTVVNKFLTDRATARKVQIDVLSPVAAELSGHRTRVDRIVKDYPLLVCAFFDPDNPTDYKELYTTCMSSVITWAMIVQEQPPEKRENLLLDRTNYGRVCHP